MIDETLRSQSSNVDLLIIIESLTTKKVWKSILI